MEVTAPFDGTRIDTVETTGAAGVEEALATAHRIFRDRDSWLPTSRRIEILRRVADSMREQRESLALLAAREGGKPLADSLVEVDRAVDGVHLCVDAMRANAGYTVPMGINAASQNRIARTVPEPIGPVVAFSAFNHPLNLIVHQVGPAIAAGCPVIVKPAEATPLSCFRFVGMLHAAGLPKEWCRALVTDNLDTAGLLVADERVGFFSFIGSARVGWMLRSRLAPGTSCALEHGGAAPVIVEADADIDAALPALSKGGFYHAGQVCVSVQRVFAHRTIARDLALRLAGLAAELRVGDPTDPATDVGPLIRPAEVARIHEWVSKSDGEVLCGGEPIGESCYRPTVLFDPSPDADVSREEIFGPVVCVYAYEHMNDAIARANSLPYAFQASVFTRDLDASLRAARRLDAAAVMVNDHTAFRVDWMPFAGVRRSGLGVGGIEHTIRDMSIEKLIVIRSPEL